MSTIRLPSGWLTRPLQEVREHVWNLLNTDESVICPCCGQHTKIYRRKINSGMAVALIKMYQHAGRDWFYKPAIHGQWQSRDEPGLQYWGLIEEATEVREDGGRAGWWRVTELGEKFIRMTEYVPMYARVYNGKLLGLNGDNISIRDALGDRFSYNELMGLDTFSD